jgi:hypothetical protein
MAALGSPLWLPHRPSASSSSRGGPFPLVNLCTSCTVMGELRPRRSPPSPRGPRVGSLCLSAAARLTDARRAASTLLWTLVTAAMHAEWWGRAWRFLPTVSGTWRATSQTRPKPLLDPLPRLVNGLPFRLRPTAPFLRPPRSLPFLPQTSSSLAPSPTLRLRSLSLRR